MVIVLGTDSLTKKTPETRFNIESRTISVFSISIALARSTQKVLNVAWKILILISVCEELFVVQHMMAYVNFKVK